MLSATFEDWLPWATPSFHWEWPYLIYLRQILDKVTRGEIDRLIIQMPPRHGKSSLATIRYSAYRIIQDPSTRVIVGAYNKNLASNFSRAVRRLVKRQVALSEERAAQSEWETQAEGGLRAVGVGSGVTGTGGDLIIVDDPVKNRKEAESETYRETVWDWYTNDLYTRLEPGGAIILIMTRWHLDDLAGRILASEDAPNWTVINLPAEAEENDLLGRSMGEALCPARFPLDKLADIKTVVGIDYHALYQQRPQARKGGLFQIDWFKLCEAVPVKAKRIRWWDKGATEAGGDYTVGVLIAQFERSWYIEDVVRGQWGPGQRDKVIRQTAEQDKLRYGYVAYWGPQDPGQAGKADSAAFVNLLAGFTVHTQPETGPKEVRAHELSSQLWAGNVYVLRAKWTAKFIQELVDFPSGAHDDQVDAASGAFSKLPPQSANSWLEYRRQLIMGEQGLVNIPGLPEPQFAEVTVPVGTQLLEKEEENPTRILSSKVVFSLQQIINEQLRHGRNAPRRIGTWTGRHRLG